MIPTSRQNIFSFFELISDYFYSFVMVFQDGIFKLCISPNSNLLVSIHHSGKLTLWELPSLRMRQAWPEDDQVRTSNISPKRIQSSIKVML
jgi:hypothetical protein